MYFKKKISSIGFTRNNLKIENKSVFKLSIKNGTEFTWKLPDVILTDLLKEKTIIKFNGKFEIHDSKNGICSRVLFTEQANFLESIKSLQSLKSMFIEIKNENKFVEKNEFLLMIFKRVGKSKMIFAEGFGDYAKFLTIDKQIYWDHETNNIPYKVTFENKKEDILPSSSILRQEISLILKKKFKDADLVFVENDREKQRIDKLKEKMPWE